LKVLSLFNNEIGVKIDYLRLKIPLFGNLILKMDTSRFITFFSIMYKNNADVLEIMTSVSKIVTNRYFAKKILDIRDKISDGMTIFSSINQEQIFPTMFRKMMAICETTGEVEFILENVRYFYEAEVKEITDKFVGLIKPVTTIILGFMLAWIGLAMLTPIYSQIGSIGDMSAQNSNY
jgi:type IV pilus assembly protein PilC